MRASWPSSVITWSFFCLFVPCPIRTSDRTTVQTEVLSRHDICFSFLRNTFVVLYRRATVGMNDKMNTISIDSKLAQLCPYLPVGACSWSRCERSSHSPCLAFALFNILTDEFLRQGPISRTSSLEQTLACNKTSLSVIESRNRKHTRKVNYHVNQS